MLPAKIYKMKWNNNCRSCSDTNFKVNSQFDSYCIDLCIDLNSLHQLSKHLVTSITSSVSPWNRTLDIAPLSGPNFLSQALYRQYNHIIYSTAAWRLRGHLLRGRHGPATVQEHHTRGVSRRIASHSVTPGDCVPLPQWVTDRGGP